MKIFKKGRLSGAEIVQWLTELREHPYIPESGFAVSAVFRARVNGVEDYYFAGVNVENIDHRISTHGEEGCIAAMVTGLGRQAEIVEGWVMGAPQNVKAGDHSAFADNMVTCCGKCRQQIAGFAEADVKIHSVALNGQMSTTTVGAFLPDLFSFRQYITDITEAKNTGAKAPADDEVKKRLIRQGALSDKDIFAWLQTIESVDYASKVSQSIVLKLDNGAYVAGAKIEEAAFVSMNPAQSALAIAVSEFGACNVEGAWVYTKGRDGKELPADNFGSLPLSSLQTLLQMAENGDVPVRFFSGDGKSVQMTLSEASKIAPTSRKPYQKKPVTGLK